jgi:glycosyltransferase involved in cell wall biosynthesis
VGRRPGVGRFDIAPQTTLLIEPLHTQEQLPAIPAMKILFLTSYFPPEIGAAQTRTYDLAVCLVRLGHDVSVLTTFPSYPLGVVPKEWRGHLYREEMMEGVHVHRVWSYPSPNRGFLKRSLSQVSFATAAACAAPWLSAADVLVVESHPLFNIIAALALHVLKRAPFVLNVSDLWPESAIYVGVLKADSPVLLFSKKLERAFYRCAALILAMTGRIRQKILEEGIRPSKVVLFRNAVDTECFRSEAADPSIRSSLGVSTDAFVVLYAGTFGHLNHITAIVETARLFHQEGNRDIQFVLVGDGAGKERLRRTARESGLDNIKFIDSLPKNRVPGLLNAADCAIISLRKLDFFRGTLPRKLFEAMACAKPVIVAGSGEPEQVVREADAGICVSPEDIRGIHDAIFALQRDCDRSAAMGRNGRKYVREHFSCERRAEQLLVHCEQVLSKLHNTSAFELSGSKITSSLSTRERASPNRGLYSSMQHPITEDRPNDLTLDRESTSRAQESHPR